MSHSQSRFSRAVIVFSIALSIPYTSQAEQVSSELQGQREYYNTLSDDACAGNQGAFDSLFEAATTHRNMVAKNDLAWVYLTESCKISHQMSLRDAIRIQKESADDGYPVAMTSYAYRLMTGDGESQNSARAEEYFEKAIDLGYGTAAMELAGHYFDGTYLPRDYSKAVTLLRTARQLGADAPDLKSLAKKLDLASARDLRFPPLQQNPNWEFDGRRASWTLILKGREHAQVVVRNEPKTGQFQFGFLRRSNNPMIHFMGVGVERSGGNMKSLPFGRCGANNCLQSEEPDGRTGDTLVLIPIAQSQSSAVLETMKSGKNIEFRFQTQDDLPLKQFTKLSLSLKGSRAAIEQVEQLANRSNTTVNTLPETPSKMPPKKIETAEQRPEASALGSPAVSCFFRTGSTMPSGNLQQNMKKMESHHKHIRGLVAANPRGSKVVLDYIWGAIPTLINISGGWQEHWLIIEQHDWYKGATVCDPDSFEYSTIEELRRDTLKRDNSRSRDNPNHRQAKDWRERILRYSD
jgi:TPR repeat protein